MLWWYAAAGDGLYEGFPLIGAKPWCCYTGVGDIENGYCERLEGWSWRDWKVDDLEALLAWLLDKAFRYGRPWPDLPFGL
jgi:hypothetical protein